MKRPVASSKATMRGSFLLKSKVSSVFPFVAEAGLGATAGEEAVLAAEELVADERGDEIQRGEASGLRVLEPRFERVGHAGEAELAERAIEFGERHAEGSLSRWQSMRSR
jgi:hypothetical protein